jgi:signal transduction histidine kinase
MGEATLAGLPRWKRPPLALGVLAAMLGIAAETMLARFLAPVATPHSLNVIYLLGLVVVGVVWGVWLGLAMAVVSALAYDLFVTPPAWSMRPAGAEFLVALAAFVAIALIASWIARLARHLTDEAGARTDADLAAELGVLLVRAPDPRTALPDAGRHLARRLGLSSASIVCGSVEPDERHVVFPLRADGRPATLVVPAGLPPPTLRRLRDRVVPSLEALLQAARARANTADAQWVNSDQLHRIADEQAALRHLATLVAHGVPPTDVLDAVAREMGKILGARRTVLARYEPNGVVTAVGGWNYEDIVPAGSHWRLEKGTVSDLVRRTGAPGRVESYEGNGDLSTLLREHGVVSSAGCPITVGRCLWGVAIASSCTNEKLPGDTEERMQNFVEIVVAAIANAQSHADLMASRARVVAATDQTRRRIERDLHDGTQQRLVTLVLELRSVAAALPPGQEQIKDQLASTARGLEEAVTDLQEIARGLHPLILAKRGLKQALTALARRCPLRVELRMSVERLEQPYEVTAYYLVSEALTNAVKHAHASVVHVTLAIGDAGIRLSVTDDGVGGADPARGSGLLGLTDRVEALGGRLHIISARGQGTTLLAEIPTVDARTLTAEPSPRLSWRAGPGT